MIEASTSVEEVDEVFEDYVGPKTYEHKIEFLKKHFNSEVIDKYEDDSPEFKYTLLANHMINGKLR